MIEKNPIYNQKYILKKLLELAYDGIVAVDADGIITLISKAYTDFLGISEKDAVGKQVNQVIESTRLPEVLKSGKAEKAHLQLIKGNYMIASRFPLIENGKVIGAIGKVLFRNIDELNVLHRRIANLQQQLKACRNNTGEQVKYSFRDIIGKSDRLLLAKTMAENAGMTDSSVLLLGESGTGKELFAHAIHRASPRFGKAFIKVNCAAIPAELLESELFGYEEGAFTGARKGGKAGKFELADGGTLFLDEIGDMPAGMQAKLLRALQEKEIEKIGSKYPLKIDVRIIAATNQDLENLVAGGRFRADLFYRLNVVSIKIPSLRERPEDINELIPYLLNKICNRLGKYADELSPQALLLLKRHHWPGNIRELENALERAVNLIGCEGVILPEHLMEKISGDDCGKVKKMQEVVENAERQALEQALKSSRGKKAKAARLLGISRSSFYQLMSKLKM
ncbi:MAG: sigma 54-interacting transcriptional regulator [Victivallaceae bacterium]|nr:sigma 54-interacting transcriptional regulator [Victivallaceae bacterium]